MPAIVVEDLHKAFRQVDDRQAALGNPRPRRRPHRSARPRAVEGAFVSYVPAGVLLDRATTPALPEVVRWSSPLVGVAFLAVCLAVWRFGERRYVSTGS